MKQIRQHFVFVILLVILMITGLLIYKDYGISWDEGSQRKENGLVNYNYIHNNDYQSLVSGNEKYHGPAFEIALIYIEKALDLKSMRDVYFMRHLVTFFVFFLSVLFFYCILYEEFRKKLIALAGVIFLILSPRIFADAFYNSKDLVFMCLVIINIYTTLRLLRNVNINNAIIHGLVTAIVIDTRVMGIMIPAFTFFLLSRQIIGNTSRIKKMFLPAFVYVIFLSAFVIAFWPVLWREPVHHFISSITEMSHYHWESYFTYLGKGYDTEYIPWHYIPVWMFVTTPLLYSLLFIIGCIYVAYRFITTRKISDYDLLNAMLFFAPLLAVIILKSVVYDGWRHLFFIYPSMLLIALKALDKLFIYFSENRRAEIILQAGVGVYSLYILIVMITLHPYECVYFNSVAGNSLNSIRKNFEIDYWGLSYMEALEHIIKTDTASSIVISPAENPGRDNLRILDEDQRIRLSITTRVELADYYLTAYRYQHDEKAYPAPFNIERNGVIASVFDLRKDKIQLNENVRVADYNYSYEEPNEKWTGGRIIENNSLTGKKCEQLDSSLEYSASFSSTLPEAVTRTGYRTYVSTTMHVNSGDPLDFRFVLQVDSVNGEMLHWDGIDLDFYRPGKWSSLVWNVLLPKGLTTTDRMKVYLWNYKKNSLLIDDVHIQVFSVPDSLYENVKKKYPLAFYRERNNPGGVFYVR